MKRFLILLTLLAVMICAFSIVAFADGTNAEEASEEVGFFEETYSFLVENSDKILSCLAFLSSLAVVIAYRRGLLPILRGGLAALSGSVGTLRSENEKAEGAAREILAAAADKLDRAESGLAELSEKLAAIEKELLAFSEEGKKAADLRTLLGVQIDLLHDIFMASSLPYYRKEEVGEKVAEMKKTLACAEEVVNE